MNSEGALLTRCIVGKMLVKLLSTDAGIDHEVEGRPSRIQAGVRRISGSGAKIRVIRSTCGWMRHRTMHDEAVRECRRGDAMGRFYYGERKVEIEDRALAHLQIVIGSKLRRGEPFYFTWREDASVGDGRTSVWMHPAASFTFRFFGSRRPTLNRKWLEALSFTANSSSGLHLVPEPAVEERSADEREFTG